MTANQDRRDRRIEVVVLTYNRPRELEVTLDRLTGLAERPIVHVIDNASTPGETEAIARRFASVDYLRLPRNIGAAARNRGVERATSPYVALCDDDTWWESGSLLRAADVFDDCPDIAVANARVLVGAENRLDGVSLEMANSTLPSRGPGRDVLGFMAGASVVRRSAFLAAGGFEPRFFLGGEEELVALDLIAAGWRIVYLPGLTVHHHPSSLRDSKQREALLLRNRLWVTWLRRPRRIAFRKTAELLGDSLSDPEARRALLSAPGGLVWALRNRRALPPETEALVRLLESPRSGIDGRPATQT
jgi:GT2 family glycosyltransferase